VGTGVPAACLRVCVVFGLRKRVGIFRFRLPLPSPPSPLPLPLPTPSRTPRRSPCPHRQIAMDTDHDGRVEVGEVIAFWLGERVSL
jgi:hypothetical protein